MRIVGTDKENIFCLEYKGEDYFFEKYVIKKLTNGKHSIDFILDGKEKNIYTDYVDGSLICNMLDRLEKRINELKKED